MSSLSATPVGNFKAAFRTQDGMHVIVLAEAAGKPAPIAIQQVEVFRLMAFLSSAVRPADGSDDLALGQRHTFPTEGINCRQAIGRPGIVVSLQIPGGMEMAFAFTNEQARQLALDLTRGQNGLPPNFYLSDTFIWSEAG